MLRARILVATLVASQLPLGAQNPPNATSKAAATQMYAKLCAGCHGADARGTQQGPGLSGNSGVRRRSPQMLRQLIQNGIPAAGMPSFDLPPDALGVLAALIASLNSSAAESIVAGDQTAGKEFFFGRGQCSSCHMVYGAGGTMGPDLSNVGREMTVDQIREALLQPDAQITPGYQLTTVHLRDGHTLRGFTRSRTNFDIQLQDLKGVFHSLSLDQLLAISEERQSLMQPVKADSDELQNLIAYLSRLTGLQVGVPTTAQPS
jgi:putative heme-binding domain-containing protein